MTDPESTPPEASALAFTPRLRESPMAALVRQLVSQLLSGGIPPGGKLPPERELAALLGVGRSNVREALKALDLLGLIEIRQGDGTYLRGTASALLPQVIEWGLFLGTPQAIDLVDARFHLEVAVARLAAERATEDDLQVMAARLAVMREADGVSDFAEADVSFHSAIADAARNQVLSDTLRSIKSLIQVWVMRVIRQAGERSSTLDQHTAVYEAIRSGDPDLAAAAMTSHMKAATENLRRSITEAIDIPE